MLQYKWMNEFEQTIHQGEKSLLYQKKSDFHFGFISKNKHKHTLIHSQLIQIDARLYDCMEVSAKRKKNGTNCIE